ncbi:NADH:ubiquinone oxidoreductase subunit NDUFA12 [Pseudoroseicyclus sp. H15]
MGLKTFFMKTFTWWNGQTWGTQLFTARKGTKVGEDAEGNVYYRNADDSKRWVIYNGYAEATRVAPEWHGWLHRSWDETPSERPLMHREWEKPHLPNLTGTAEAYAPPGSLRRAPAERTDYESWSPE